MTTNITLKYNRDMSPQALQNRQSAIDVLKESLSDLSSLYHNPEGLNSLHKSCHDMVETLENFGDLPTAKMFRCAANNIKILEMQARNNQFMEQLRTRFD